MRRIIEVAFLAAALIATSACSGGAGVSISPGGSGAGTQNLVAGNWVLTTQSQILVSATPTQYEIGGAMSASGNTVSGALSALSGACLVAFNSEGLLAPLSFSGAINGNALTNLVNIPGQAPSGAPTAVINISGTVYNGTNIQGSYTMTGGPPLDVQNATGCNGDYGTVYGTLVPPVSGSWAGTLGNYASNGLNFTCGGSICQTGASVKPGQTLSGYLYDPNANGSATFATGSFSVQLGTGSPGTVTVTGTTTTPHGYIDNSLAGAADLINALGLGIKASVASNLGNSWVKLVDSTGNNGVVAVTNNTTGLPFEDTVYVTLSLTQGTTANSNGSFPLSGTVGITAQAAGDAATQQSMQAYYTPGSGGGQIDSTQSYIQGDNVYIATLADSTGATLSIVAFIGSPNLAQQMVNITLTPSSYILPGPFAGDIAVGGIPGSNVNNNLSIFNLGSQ